MFDPIVGRIKNLDCGTYYFFILKNYFYKIINNHLKLLNKALKFCLLHKDNFHNYNNPLKTRGHIVILRIILPHFLSSLVFGDDLKNIDKTAP